MENNMTLRLTFLDDKGKKKNLLVAEPAENLSVDQVKTAMAGIRDANVFGMKRAIIIEPSIRLLILNARFVLCLELGLPNLKMVIRRTISWFRGHFG